MIVYKKFIFERFDFDNKTGIAKFYYSFDGVLDFSESYQFVVEDNSYDEKALNRALFDLFIMAGISYYKSHLVDEVEIKNNMLTQNEANFFFKTYQKGLGEYYFVNQLDPRSETNFDYIQENENLEIIDSKKLLIGVGGGKDSLVTIEALRDSGLDIATWSLNHEDKLKPLVDRIGIKHYFVKRSIDSKLLEENENGALNGHVPISAILSFAGVVQAILLGRSDVVVSNEQTANEPTLTYEGVNINHQYSKSQEFERDLIKLLSDSYNNVIKYYSFLRPLTELRIGEIFAKNYLDKYIDVFSSCNRAFTHKSDGLSWCGECPKCAFVFLIFSPFVDRQKLESIWNGKNLLLEDSLVSTYKELLGIEGNKPLECVGEIKESRSAMRLAFEKYPELENKYIFDIPEDYDYKKIYSDEMPDYIKDKFNSWITKF